MVIRPATLALLASILVPSTALSGEANAMLVRLAEEAKQAAGTKGTPGLSAGTSLGPVTYPRVLTPKVQARDEFIVQLVTLAPGETAKIKASGRWHAVSDSGPGGNGSVVANPHDSFIGGRDSRGKIFHGGQLFFYFSNRLFAYQEGEEIEISYDAAQPERSSLWAACNDQSTRYADQGAGQRGYEDNHGFMTVTIVVTKK